jgi:hypothetical protein
MQGNYSARSSCAAASSPGEQLQAALDKQRQLKSQEQIGDLLVSMGLITERDRVRALGEQWGVAFVDLSERVDRARDRRAASPGARPPLQGDPDRAGRARA